MDEKWPTSILCLDEKWYPIHLLSRLWMQRSLVRSESARHSLDALEKSEEVLTIDKENTLRSKWKPLNKPLCVGRAPPYRSRAPIHIVGMHLKFGCTYRLHFSEEVSWATRILWKTSVRIATYLLTYLPTYLPTYLLHLAESA
jgi:hypothetical protein